MKDRKAALTPREEMESDGKWHSVCLLSRVIGFLSCPCSLRWPDVMQAASPVIFLPPLHLSSSTNLLPTNGLFVYVKVMIASALTLPSLINSTDPSLIG